MTAGFRTLALATTLATYLEIVLGGTVRATGSGEACPDWPTCHGQVIPSLSGNVLIEYSHRLTASLVSVLVVLLLVAAVWLWRQPRYLKILCGIALGLLVLQVILGGVTVLANLPPQIVTAHLATATALLGVLTVISVYTFTGRSGERDPNARWLRLSVMLAAGGTFLVILTGSAVVGGDAGLACGTWPLCNGQLVPTGGHTAVDLAYLHRVMALLVGVAIIIVGVGALVQRSERPALFWTAMAAVAVYLAQALVGAANVWFGLAAAVRIAHLATAQAVWVLTAALTVLVAAPVHRAADIGAPPVRRPLPLAPSPDRRSRFGDRVRRAGDPTERGRP